ncbi:hypothetical protein [Bradyrhizobium sp. B117]|uniref:hypothetical protein n=1 Tax=Bradyrhizobium sp. B117 TaxID=3140246 RepID=UPI003182D326
MRTAPLLIVSIVFVAQGTQQNVYGPKTYTTHSRTRCHAAKQQSVSKSDRPRRAPCRLGELQSEQQPDELAALTTCRGSAIIRLSTGCIALLAIRDLRKTFHGAISGNTNKIATTALLQCCA